MLGSRAEAEDAVQEAWLRLTRTPAGEIENLGKLVGNGGRARLPRIPSGSGAPDREETLASGAPIRG